MAPVLGQLLYWDGPYTGMAPLRSLLPASPLLQIFLDQCLITFQIISHCKSHALVIPISFQFWEEFQCNHLKKRTMLAQFLESLYLFEHRQRQWWVSKPELRTNQTEPGNSAHTAWGGLPSEILGRWPVLGRGRWSVLGRMRCPSNPALSEEKISKSWLCWVSGIFKNCVRRIFLIYTWPLWKKSICHLTGCLFYPSIFI